MGTFLCKWGYPRGWGLSPLDTRGYNTGRGPEYAETLVRLGTRVSMMRGCELALDLTKITKDT